MGAAGRMKEMKDFSIPLKHCSQTEIVFVGGWGGWGWSGGGQLVISNLTCRGK